jgi:hypothetical protein
MDLGLRVYQQYWKAIYLPWLALLIPLFIVLNTLLFEALWVVPILLWWLKPLYDRLVLHILSRSLFGEIPDTRSSLRALPAAIKNGLFLQLTLFRLDPSRSFRLPVMQLEGLQGKKRSHRMRVLHARGSTPAFWLTITCLHIELALNIALFGLIYLLMPQDIGLGVLSPFFAEVPPWWADLLSNFLYLISLSLMEPIYVASGFMLYLNRRTELEGWDIELIFRRMAQRLKALAQGGMAALLLIGLIAVEPSAQAEEFAEPLPVSESARVIQEVLAHPDFGTTHTEEQWRFSDFDWDLDEEEEEEDSWLSALSFEGLAGIIKALIILGVLGAIAYLLHRYRDAISEVATPSGKRPSAPDVVMGLDIRPESLPDDIPAEARRLWAAGEHRQAMSLLYRAMLSRLVNTHDLEINEGDTEADILRSTRTLLAGERYEFLGQLTQAWQLIAYAHRPPADEGFEVLATSWTRVFPEQEVGA